MDSSHTGSFPRVLLADDSPDNRLLMSLYLRRTGIQILTASNGEETLQVTAAMQPDLVLIDLSMPGMSGFEVCKRIKANPATTHTPVVFLTTLENRDDRINGVEAGADDFFLKPVQRDEFLLRVKSLLTTRRRTDPVAGPEAEAPYVRHNGFERQGQRRLADRTLPTPDGHALAGYQTRFDAVILFADLRGFTRMAEQLPPTQVVALLNQYFSLLTGITYRYEGVIFNMAGDCLLIGFGVPFEQPDAAERAVRAGYDMLAEFESLSTEWKLKHGLETGLGVGVNKGEVVAGNVGSPAYMSFTIIGDAVNIASRLMQRARAGELLLSDTVMEALQEAQVKVDAIPLPPLTLRGRSEPIGLYCIPFRDRGNAVHGNAAD